jgi:hypothetical protein
MVIPCVRGFLFLSGICDRLKFMLTFFKGAVKISCVDTTRKKSLTKMNYFEERLFLYLAINEIT